MNSPQSEPTPQPLPKRASVLFQLTAMSAVLFIVTVLALVATVFGDPSAPAARKLNQNAGKLIAIEVAATLLLGLAAMTQDRRQTLSEQKQLHSEPQAKVE